MWAPVAQLDRASDYGSEGWEFESLRAREVALSPVLLMWCGAFFAHRQGRSERREPVRALVWSLYLYIQNIQFPVRIT